MRIVYLCMEDSPDSHAGLQALANADGVEPALVVAHLATGRVRRPAMPWHDLPLHFLIEAVKRARRAFRVVRRLILHGGRRPPGPIARLCTQMQIPLVLTRSQRIADHRDEIRAARPDVIMANGWPFWIPPFVCKLARVETLNCHPSYLPEYRGFNVTRPLLIDGAESTGVTVHVIQCAFDSGLILAQRRIPLGPGETVASIRRKRAKAMGPVILEALRVAGHPELYTPNPPSPYYPRCSRATILRHQAVNTARRLLGMQALKFPPSDDYAGCPERKDAEDLR